MKRFAAAAVFTFVATAGIVRCEEVTPLSAGLREEAELFVTCALPEAPLPGAVPVLRSTAECAEATGIYHYRLWLPRGYLAQPQRRWPCLFLASPFGNARLAKTSSLKTAGYVIVMLTESRNGRWPPAIGNFLAAHDDVMKRVRIREGAKIATGLSGGARASAIFVQIRPGFAGAILQGAGASHDEGGKFYFDGAARQSSLSIAMTIGRGDIHLKEIAEMQNCLRPEQLAVFLFPGGHEWAPPEIFAQALRWIEQRASSRSTTFAHANTPGAAGH